MTLISEGSYSPKFLAAEPDGLKRSNLLQDNLSINGWEVIQDCVEFAPGEVSQIHSHPGEEIIYVLNSMLKYEIKGQPTATLTVGKSILIPAGAIHRATNVGEGNASELATYILEKGKQFFTLQPCNALP